MKPAAPTIRIFTRTPPPSKRPAGAAETAGVAIVTSLYTLVRARAAPQFATEAALKIASSAIQVHGAAGIARDYGIERHFRNARMLTIPDGTTQINRLVIGRELLGTSAFG